MILLDAPFLDTDAYLRLIHRGASPAYSKIRNDTFRTLTTDPLFRRRVSEASLIRLLNAVAWKLHDAREEQRRPSTSAGASVVSVGASSVSAGNSRPTSSRHSLGGYHFHHNNTGGSSSSNNNSRPSTAAAAASRPSTGVSRPGSSRSDFSMMMFQQQQQQQQQQHQGQYANPNSSPAARHRARALTLTTEGSEAGAGGAGASEPGTYVQGMNVLAAPFLYAARSEAEAFVAFHRLLTRECPGYIRGAMDGVHRGLALVDKALAIVDPKLGLFLTSKGLSAEIYAFPSVLTLCACTPPLPEVLRLWDFLFAYGPHLNIPCIVAQLIMMRNELLESPRFVRPLSPPSPQTFLHPPFLLKIHSNTCWKTANVTLFGPAPTSCCAPSPRCRPTRSSGRRSPSFACCRMTCTPRS